MVTLQAVAVCAAVVIYAVADVPIWHAAGLMMFGLVMVPGVLLPMNGVPGQIDDAAWVGFAVGMASAGVFGLVHRRRRPPALSKAPAPTDQQRALRQRWCEHWIGAVDVDRAGGHVRCTLCAWEETVSQDVGALIAQARATFDGQCGVITSLRGEQT